MAGSLGQIGPYEVYEELGRGAMAVVYRARHTQLNNIVALKLFSPTGPSAALLRERFFREARAMSKADHPHVTRVYDVGEYQHYCYLVMEYLRGSDLATVMRQQGQADLESGVRWLKEVASGLATVHQHGIIHRDLKPANIMICDGVAKIADFGLMYSERESDLTHTGELIGTPAYMSPEQFTMAGRNLDTRSDLFSLGVIAYEMFSGHHPFVGPTIQSTQFRIVHEEPVKVNQIRPDLPSELSDLIHSCLQKSRDHRIKTATQIAQALDNIRVKNPSITTQPPGDAAIEIESVRQLEKPIRAAPGRSFPYGWIILGIVCTAFAIVFTLIQQNYNNDKKQVLSNIQSLKKRLSAARTKLETETKRLKISENQFKTVQKEATTNSEVQYIQLEFEQAKRLSAIAIDLESKPHSYSAVQMCAEASLNKFLTVDQRIGQLTARERRVEPIPINDFIEELSKITTLTNSPPRIDLQLSVPTARCLNVLKRICRRNLDTYSQELAIATFQTLVQKPAANSPEWGQFFVEHATQLPTKFKRRTLERAIIQLSKRSKFREAFAVVESYLEDLKFQGELTDADLIILTESIQNMRRLPVSREWQAKNLKFDYLSLGSSPTETQRSKFVRRILELNFFELSKKSSKESVKRLNIALGLNQFYPNSLSVHWHISDSISNYALSEANILSSRDINNLLQALDVYLRRLYLPGARERLREVGYRINTFRPMMFLYQLGENSISIRYCNLLLTHFQNILPAPTITTLQTIRTLATLRLVGQGLLSLDPKLPDKFGVVLDRLPLGGPLQFEIGLLRLNHHHATGRINADRYLEKSKFLQAALDQWTNDPMKRVELDYFRQLKLIVRYHRWRVMKDEFGAFDSKTMTAGKSCFEQWQKINGKARQYETVSILTDIYFKTKDFFARGR